MNNSGVAPTPHPSPHQKQVVGQGCGLTVTHLAAWRGLGFDPQQCPSTPRSEGQWAARRYVAVTAVGAAQHPPTGAETLDGPFCLEAITSDTRTCPGPAGNGFGDPPCPPRAPRAHLGSSDESEFDGDPDISFPRILRGESEPTHWPLCPSLSRKVERPCHVCLCLRRHSEQLS